MGDPTIGFLAALERDVKPLRDAATNLDGLWGKGIGNAGVDRQVLSTMKRKLGVAKAAIGDLEKLAAGEVPE